MDQVGIPFFPNPRLPFHFVVLAKAKSTLGTAERVLSIRSCSCSRPGRSLLLKTYRIVFSQPLRFRSLFFYTRDEDIVGIKDSYC